LTHIIIYMDASLGKRINTQRSRSGLQLDSLGMAISKESSLRH